MGETHSVLKEGKSFLKNVLKLSEGINKRMDEADLIDSSTWISKRPLKESFGQAFSVVAV